MKTSNYILIALFSFIIVSTLVLFIAAIGHENDYYGGAQFDKKEYSLEDFSTIVVEPNLHVEFNSSENNSLSFYFPKGQEVNEKPFRIINDTLFVCHIADFNSLNLKVSGSELSTIVAKSNSRVRLNHFNSKTLSVDIQQANFTLDNSEIGKLNILGNKAEILAYSNKIESLSARLKNGASLDIKRNVNKVDIEKDETSRYFLYR